MNKMIEKLIDAAKEEKWEIVDSTIPAAVRVPEVVDWAYKEGVNDPNGNVRDLAASVLEKADISSNEIPEVRKALSVQLEDSHPYARFRAACALAAHGPGEYATDVKIVLKEFRDDPEVRDIAKKYISLLG